MAIALQHKSAVALINDYHFLLLFHLDRGHDGVACDLHNDVMGDTKHCGGKHQTVDGEKACRLRHPPPHQAVNSLLNEVKRSRLLTRNFCLQVRIVFLKFQRCLKKSVACRIK